MNGAKEVKIYSELYEVVAKVGSIRSMSAHGDYEDLSQYLSSQDPNKVKQLFLVHGEYNVQEVALYKSGLQAHVDNTAWLLGMQLNYRY